MYSFKQFLTEAISANIVPKTKKEFQAFTKNVNRIKNAKDLAIVHKAYATWVDNFEDLIFKRILGTDIQFDRTKNNEPTNFWEDEVRKACWEIVINPEIFLEKVPHRAKEDARTKGQLSGSASVYGDEWEAMYDYFDKNRKYVYNRLGKMGREAFKALDNFFKEQSSVVDKNMPEYEMVEGVRVIIRSVEGNSNVSYIKKALAEIKKALRILKKSGFGKLLKGLKIELIASSSNLSAAAEYDLKTQTVMVYLFGADHNTIIHEIGHRMWYEFITKEQQELWNDFYDKNLVSFSEDELEIIEAAFWKHYGAIKEGNSLFYGVEKYITSDTAKVKYQSAIQADFMRSDLDLESAIKPRSESWRTSEENSAEQKKTATRKIKLFRSYYSDWRTNKVLINPITAYGATQNTESYPEAFTHYILRNARMNPLVKQVFKHSI